MSSLIITPSPNGIISGRCQTLQKVQGINYTSASYFDLTGSRKYCNHSIGLEFSMMGVVCQTT